MTAKIYIPRDTTSVSLGADKIATKLAAYFDDQQIAVEIVRNGSRGLYWLEPMIEVDTEQGRMAYGPVTLDALADFIDGECWLGNKQNPLCLGLTDEIAYLKNQQRLTFARVGVIDPLSLADYRQSGGFIGLEKALMLSSQQLVDAVKDSGLRGRGGAAFPTGIKWQTVLDTVATQKYIVCNADEGDSGTYADRMLMESDPLSLIEGMIIAGLAVGASHGYIYLREEYPLAHQQLKQAIAIAQQHNYLGDNIAGSEHSFSLEVRLGAGAYICGEETALLDSLEGKRGMVRAKPPLPAIKGLFGLPTVINNVISLATVPWIFAHGADAYQQYGMGRSRGSLAFQLAGNVKRAGLVELAFGTSLGVLLNQFGGGTRTEKPIKAVQVGGPLGAYLSVDQLDIALDYETFTAADAVLGHGGVVVFDDSVDMSEQAQFSMEFCAVESCGKCTPCRIGSSRGVELIDTIRGGDNAESSRELLEDLCDTMANGSLCAMGGMTPIPVLSALKQFPEDFGLNNISQGDV
ncbi:NADH-quinone oxidoreductase subunit NuoF [Oceanicoccus sp. KOV_DT_Chl]|uniref:formate dehydrogenase beta subunit n=1 Tax=Oceanicoccus sp. KOV_DT_Chl TaxID=1904639 RepID=UPI000C7D1D1C|nr:formate dehydrogenase beta subunit [Oceanicoccus sp. KOV_DT_Chl]